MWRETGRLELVVTTFTGGLVAGGCTTALAAWLVSGLLGWLPPSARLAIVAAMLAGVAAHEAGLATLRLPSTHRQVPQEVFTNGPYLAAAQFGYELGTGVRTYLPSLVPYLAVTTIAMTGPGVGAAVLCGFGFGAGRAAMPVARTASPAPLAWDEALRRHERWIRLLTLGAASACVAAVL